MGSVDDIIGKSKLVLLEFSAEWCGSCQTLDPVLVEVKGHFKDSLDIVKIDIDVNGALVAGFHIQSVPTLILYSAGEEVWRQAGLMTKSQLLRIIGNYLA